VPEFAIALDVLPCPVVAHGLLVVETTKESDILWWWISQQLLLALPEKRTPVVSSWRPQPAAKVLPQIRSIRELPVWTVLLG
jgi:hypothetical protein